MMYLKDIIKKWKIKLFPLESSSREIGQANEITNTRKQTKNQPNRIRL